MIDEEKSECTSAGELHTDERKHGDWKTIYPGFAWLQIGLETLYLFSLLFGVFYSLYLVWSGCYPDWLLNCNLKAIVGSYSFRAYSYYSLAGLLGGLTFGIKYHYRVIGRGYWHQDRCIWRLMSPFVSMVLGLLVGAMVESSFIHSPASSSGAAKLTIGFLAGYFADKAVGKMYEFADALFGKSPRN